MASGLQRLQAELTGVSGPGKRPDCWFESGVVQAVVNGYDDYGYEPELDFFTITWRGKEVTVPYLANYTPIEGDVVLLAVQPPSVMCLGRLMPVPSDTLEA